MGGTISERKIYMFERETFFLGLTYTGRSHSIIQFKTPFLVHQIDCTIFFIVKNCNTDSFSKNETIPTFICFLIHKL